MELVKPEFGLIFWMTVSFLIVLFLLKKFAWKPILDSLRDRETSIEEALNSAKKARDEVANMKAENERILQDARNERDVLLKQARETKDQIVNEARTKAQSEADRIITNARETINNEKIAAVNDFKNQVASLSIEIAEKVLQKEMAAPDTQKKLIQDLLKDIKIN